MSILYTIYLIASLTFILGLKMLGSPKSARRGNLIAAFGMTLAIFGTIFLYEDEGGKHLHNLEFIFGGLLLGTGIGWLMAKKVQMTAMPQMVSFFNGMGGACAALISVIEFRHLVGHTEGGFAAMMASADSELLIRFAIMYAGLIIGSISFSGSIVAYGKLEGKIKDKMLPGQQAINIGLFLAIVGLAFCHVHGIISMENMLYIVAGLALLYGVLFVMPIGGADMPVVISLLNSFTGVAAAFGGFLYDNKVMLIGGILVGSAGTLLTIVMCQAMNRSLLNVLIGNFGGGGASSSSAGPQGTVKSVNASDAAILMKYAKKVVIVPGYGLAVAQAQHVVHELEELLEFEGVEVKYAIHPVAGRMPGHMNVLLAESNVDYDKLVEMEDINPEFPTTDVVLVIGANDVVNPAAKTDPGSPIYGMPILDVEQAQQTIVMKRSMNAGYAGIENELFYRDKTSMLFGDAKKMLTELVSELKAMQ
ncbi:MAG: NAD(P)(+) transhydrogenase (Re/Si-specific) subunit beta [Bacteroidota bacterium]|nr:NAD(P)(+) transhydrogenase (Re/Si-specific) subunit beta [Bacteroidota bacterium]MDX5429782.1 NAD(P)(+) transhydrogenase (Re/Si-specific) subunit beta [Bacteroidota bacterium]MDX5468561.1 NAD(P)(+) transhydrogenase (Re/Si-specific) subunit beta [Bacteroidota bacterium]